MLSTIQELYSLVLVKALLVVLFSLWLRWIWSRRQLYLASYKLPGPMALPILGNAIQMGSFGNHRKIMPKIKKLSLEYDGFFRVWFGPTFMVCISEAEDYENILLSKMTYNKGFMYDLVKYVVKDGLFTASGDIWKKHRQIINPAFAISTIKKYQNNHNYYSNKMVESMKNVLDKGIVDVSIFASRYFSDTVCDSLYEIKCDFFTGQYDSILKSVNNATVLLHERICKFWLHPDALYERSDSCRRFMKSYKDYSNFFHPLFLKKFQEYVDDLKANNQKLEKTGSYENLDADYILEENANVKNKTIINILAESYLAGDLSMQEVINEFDNIYNPATETSFTQLSSFMLLLGMHKQVQDKLWREIKDFYSYDLDADVTNEHFIHLPYLDMVLKETMRCFPSGPMQARKLKEDFYLKNRDVTLPAGTQILLVNILLHKNEKYWKNPLEFNPDRFLPEEVAKRPHFAFIPFSIGLRNCIGQVFAFDSIKTAAIHLMRNYEFTADPSSTMQSLSYVADISTRIEAGYKVRVSRRNRDL